MGEAFKEFGCRCCSFKSGSKRQWLKMVDAHALLEGDELKEANVGHNRDHYRHNPYSPPWIHQGAIANSADILHLEFINLFCFFLETTALVYVFEWDAEARAPFENYMRSIGIPMKATKAQSLTEMRQSLTGRDAKVIVSKALTHIPAILAFVNAGAEAIAEELRAPAPPTGTVDDDDDDEAVTWRDPAADADGDAAMDAEPSDLDDRELRDAKSWDAYLGMVYAARAFERDDAEYREARAVEQFNAAGRVVEEHRRLSPDAKSACPHVALCVVPRQMVEDGDPGRRGTDHSESFGAAIKDGIHRRTLRRKLGVAATQHKRRKADGTVKHWTQRPLAVSRIMQCFRDVVVREKLLREAASLPYMQRKHVRLASTGFVMVDDTDAEEPIKAPPASVRAKIEECRECS